MRRVRNALLIAVAVMASIDDAKAQNQKNDKKATAAPVTFPPSTSPSIITGAPSALPSQAPVTSTPTVTPTVTPTTFAPSVFPTLSQSSSFPLTATPSTLLPSSTPTKAPFITLSPTIPLLEATTAPVLSVQGILDAVTNSPTEHGDVGSSAPIEPEETASPTSVPVIPSSEPSLLPKMLLTATPSTTMSPTQVPVTARPSLPQPTNMPSIMPSVGLAEVEMPEMEIDFDGLGDFKPETLEADLKAFLEEYIASSSENLGDLDSVELDVSVEINGGAIRQVNIPNRVDVSVGGSVYFNVEERDAPTSANLGELLKTYFGFWGDDDLIKELARGNITVQNLELIINGVVIESQESNPSGTVNSPESSSNDARNAAGLIAGFVIGCIALLGAVALLVWQRRMNRERDDMNSQNAVDSRAPLSGPQASARSLPRMESATAAAQASGDNDSHGGVVSLEDSLYTSATDQVYNPILGTGPDEYDAKRLDRVISNAHNYVASQKDPFDMD